MRASSISFYRGSLPLPHSRISPIPSARVGEDAATAGGCLSAVAEVAMPGIPNVKAGKRIS